MTKLIIAFVILQMRLKNDNTCLARQSQSQVHN